MCKLMPKACLCCARVDILSAALSDVVTEAGAMANRNIEFARARLEAINERAARAFKEAAAVDAPQGKHE